MFGTALSPIYLNRAASQKDSRGIEFHRAASRMAFGWLLRNRDPRALRWLVRFVGSPLALTRYQEFDFAWRKLPNQITQYLDVSSPVFFPIRLLNEHPNVKATLVNPDQSDLAFTRELVQAGNFTNRVTSKSVLIEDLDEPDEHFDLITSISVIEHIPDNKSAIQKLWRLLKRGGSLLISMPCSARAYSLYTNSDRYGLLEQDKKGQVFFEYLYDDALLEEFIFSVTGKPKSVEIYGEIRPGFLRNEIVKNWTMTSFKFWEEPLMMNREFTRFKRISDLPGEGVIALEFVKP